MAGPRTKTRKADDHGDPLKVPPPNFDPAGLLAELADRRQRGRQTVVTPLNEVGIELEPITPSGRNVSANITRTWAALWGFDGSNLRMVHVDMDGNLIGLQDSAEMFTTVERTGTLTGAVWSVEDYGSTFHRFRFWTSTTNVEMEFSTDNVNWFGKFYWNINVRADPVYARCRYVRFRDIDHMGVTDYHLAGDQRL